MNVGEYVNSEITLEHQKMLKLLQAFFDLTWLFTSQLSGTQTKIKCAISYTIHTVLSCKQISCLREAQQFLVILPEINLFYGFSEKKKL